MECALFFLFIAFAVSHPIYDKITDRGGIIQIGGDDFLSSESLELVKMPADKSEGGLPQLKRLHELMATILKGRHSGVADGGVARAPRPKRNVNRKKPEYEYYDRWRQRNEPQILVEHTGVSGIRSLLNGTSFNEFTYDYEKFNNEYRNDMKEEVKNLGE
ncbi:hypothetical protein AAG570_001594 [Ranatra chinensis]|uniref:Uncharacterized protein n=1 Tax=Ranatra chinensis TaxID=642074 RepID=A0ABD0YRK6_9HEMI